jgi:hypothetical protein
MLLWWLLGRLDLNLARLDYDRTITSTTPFACPPAPPFLSPLFVSLRRALIVVAKLVVVAAHIILENQPHVRIHPATATITTAAATTIADGVAIFTPAAVAVAVAVAARACDHKTGAQLQW